MRTASDFPGAPRERETVARRRAEHRVRVHRERTAALPQPEYREYLGRLFESHRRAVEKGEIDR